MNFVKIALRNIRKHKGYSLINVVGLAIGIACSVLVFLFVSYELSFDRYHEKADRIYRLAVTASIGDTKINQAVSSARTLQKGFWLQYISIEGFQCRSRWCLVILTFDKIGLLEG